MSTNPFVILGVPQNASQSEILAAYKEKRAYYQEHLFDEGESGAEAARNIGILDNAYQQAMEMAAEIQYSTGDTISTFDEVKTFIKNHEPDKAQSALDNISYRSAEWHYFQSIIFFEKNWLLDSKKQLEICIEMEPSNEKYRRSLDNINKKIDGSNPHAKQGQDFDASHRTTASHRTYQQQDENAQAGQDACCATCQALWCLDCCCECMGGDFIRCC